MITRQTLAATWREEALDTRLRARLLACARQVLGDAAEAEDVVQEALVKALAADLRDPAALRGWLFAVCYRLAIDVVRRRTRRGKAHGALTPPDEEPGSSGLAMRREQQEELHRQLGSLAEPYRSALRLRYLQELEFAEVARRMGAKERTVRTWVGRGLQRLRRRLGGR